MKLITATFCFLVSTNSFSQTENISQLIIMAEAGSKSSIYNLGVKYGNGDGVRVNHETAFKYYIRASEMNYAPAQNNLGWAYRQGLGTQINYKKALYWFKISAIQNNALALQNLAEMFQNGEGVKKNIDTAELLYKLCATTDAVVLETGFSNAIHECRRELGKIILQRTSNKEEDLKYAALWFMSSLFELKDVKDDSEIGVRARRSANETKELFLKTTAQLNQDSKDWLIRMDSDFSNVRWAINDTTHFPFSEIDDEISSSR